MFQKASFFGTGTYVVFQGCKHHVLLKICQNLWKKSKHVQDTCTYVYYYHYVIIAIIIITRFTAKVHATNNGKEFNESPLATNGNNIPGDSTGHYILLLCEFDMFFLETGQN